MAKLAVLFLAHLCRAGSIDQDAAPMEDRVTLKARAGNWLKTNHPWLFRDALERVEAANGAVVGVFDAGNRRVGTGLYSAHSKIAVRMIHFGPEPVGEDWLYRRIKQALGFRNQVVRDATAYRLVSSEADGIPGLVVDRYGDHLAFQTLTPATDQLKDRIVDYLGSLLKPICIVERNDPATRKLEGLEQKSRVLFGSLRTPLIVEESGVRYEVDVLRGQKTGAYLDQRENRLAAAGYARGRVLDCFCYQGNFALHFARGAESVLAVDSSESALAAGARNAALNDARNIDFKKAKALDFLRELRDRDERFELINLDPPAFAKTRAEIEGAERGYREINLRALGLLNSGGFLVTSSCSYHMTEERLIHVVQQAAAKIGRLVRLVEKRTQAKDHPILLSMPESLYLKCLVLQVIE